MEIIEAILKIYPDWKGVVWENDYKRIVPHVLEKRSIPSQEELEAAWKEVLADREAEAEAAETEVLIQEKVREQAVAALASEGKLTAEGLVKKTTKADQRAG